MMSDAQIRDRIVVMLRRWPRGGMTPGAIGTQVMGSCRLRTTRQRDAILAAMEAEGTIEPCEIREEYHARSGPYRRTFRGYRLTRKEESDVEQ